MTATASKAALLSVKIFFDFRPDGKVRCPPRTDFDTVPPGGPLRF